MKKILFVADRLQAGGTTSALLSVLYNINYDEYEVDLLLFKNEGEFMRDIPPQVNLLEAAYKPKIKFIKHRFKKIFLSFFDGSFIGTLKAYFKYKGSNKGNIKGIFFNFLERQLQT